MKQSELHIIEDWTDENGLLYQESSMGGQLKNFFVTLLKNTKKELIGADRMKHIGTLLNDAPSAVSAQLRIEWDQFLNTMDELGASDIDFGGSGCGGQIWYRIHGIKKPVPQFGTVSADFSDAMILSLLNPLQRDILLKKNIDFSYKCSKNNSDMRYRADAYFDLDHLAMNMRCVPNVIRPFADLQLHPNVAGILNLKTHKQGLTLVTGITGSGKSTTLDSIIEANNRLSEAHIVIIGSPIETVHAPIKCVVRHREVGRDVSSFKDGAVQSLRQDPDIIVIGEMRDPDTVMTALEITDSGHKVFSTLHTASAVESIDRIIGETQVEEQERIRHRLADTLACIISQKLVPACNDERTLAKEVLILTPSVRAAIRNNNTGEIYQMIHEGAGLGMHTLEQDLSRLVKQRIIERETALNFANNKKRMEELLG